MDSRLVLAACTVAAGLSFGSISHAQTTPPPVIVTQPPVRTVEPVVVTPAPVIVQDVTVPIEDPRFVPVEPVYTTSTAGVMTAAAVEPAEPDRLLMGALKQNEVGTWMEDNGVYTYGHVQAGWTIAEPEPAGGLIPGRLFDLENQDLTFNQLYWVIGKEAAMTPDAMDFGGQLDLLYGGDARFMHSNGFLDDNGFDNGPDEQFDIPQIYGSMGIPVGTGLGLKIGKWSTLGGYEVVDPTGNAFYSHAYIFNFCLPFAHTGVLASYGLSDEMSVDFGISRGWDQACEDVNDMPDFLGRLNWGSVDGVNAVYTTGYVGPQSDANDKWLYVLDVVGTHQYADNLSLAMNFNYGYSENGDPDGGAGQWAALEGWGTLKWSEMMSFSTRVGWINDDNGTKGLGCDVYHLTVGVALTPFADNAYGRWFTVRPEVRGDYSEESIFGDGDDHFQTTFGIDAVYMF